MQWLLLVAGIALVAAGAVDDPSFRWGEYAFAECRKLVRASGKRDVKRGFCERVQEAFENYIEGTGNQLAEAMGVSFSGQLGPRLFSQPYKAQGEQGVRTWLTKAIASGLYTNEDITTGLNSFASSWLLHATADDQKGAAQLPPDFDLSKLPMMGDQNGKPMPKATPTPVNVDSDEEL